MLHAWIERKYYSIAVSFVIISSKNVQLSINASTATSWHGGREFAFHEVHCPAARIIWNFKTFQKSKLKFPLNSRSLFKMKIVTDNYNWNRMVANTVKTLRRATVNLFQLHMCHQNWELISRTVFKDSLRIVRSGKDK